MTRADIRSRGTTSKKDKVVIPPAKGYVCERTSLEDAMRFVLGVETEDWTIDSSESGFYDGVKVLHIHLPYTGSPGVCPDCKSPMVIHDYKNRDWRHENLGDTVCYIHARVPRCQCKNCKTIAQMRVPRADPMVSYTKQFEEMAINKMFQMSLAAVSREMRAPWRVLDYIVERRVRMYLDHMDLSGLRRIRIDETSAKKNHRYIAIVTDVDTGRIVFISRARTRVCSNASQNGCWLTMGTRRRSHWSHQTSGRA